MQREGDSTRRRRHFDLHARLVDPLAEWYAAVDRLDPGRVLHGFPAALDAVTRMPPRSVLYPMIRDRAAELTGPLAEGRCRVADRCGANCRFSSGSRWF